MRTPGPDTMDNPNGPDGIPASARRLSRPPPGGLSGSRVANRARSVRGVELLDQPDRDPAAVGDGVPVRPSPLPNLLRALSVRGAADPGCPASGPAATEAARAAGTSPGADEGCHRVAQCGSVLGTHINVKRYAVDSEGDGFCTRPVVIVEITDQQHPLRHFAAFLALDDGPSRGLGKPI